VSFDRKVESVVGVWQEWAAGAAGGEPLWRRYQQLQEGKKALEFTSLFGSVGAKGHDAAKKFFYDCRYEIMGAIAEGVNRQGVRQLMATPLSGVAGTEARILSAVEKVDKAHKKSEQSIRDFCKWLRLRRKELKAYALDSSVYGSVDG
jgi:hypothetical protein